MIALTNREILDELTNLGVTSTAELNAYLRDYLRYFQVFCTREN
jgi:hypothetical protein